MQWTGEQLAAIKSRKSNLLLSAAAGSGKTAVLIERIVHLIREDRVDVDRMLVVTFTKAAAAEMKERLSKRIYELLQQEPEDVFLREQLSRLSRAQISTLHNFSKKIIKEHFQVLGIDPSFRIGDETEIRLLKKALIDDFLEEMHVEEPGLEHLIRLLFRGRDDLPFETFLLRLHQFIQSKVEPLVWLKESCSFFENDAWISGELGEFICAETARMLQEIIDDFEAGQELTENDPELQSYGKNFSLDIEELKARKELATSLQVETLFQKMLDFSLQRIGTAKKNADPVCKEQATFLKNKGKKILKKLQEDFFYEDLPHIQQQLRFLAPDLVLLFRLVEDFDQRYQAQKREKNILDFDDLEHMALQVLQDPAICREYQDHFSYVFVDEYQDSNQVQEAIVQSVSSEHNLFMVGDVKQSIYRFRLAEPELFLKKLHTFQEDLGVQNRKINLSQNFRSARVVLDFVNDLFQGIMSEELGEVVYDEKARLYPGLMEKTGSGKMAPVEIDLLDKTETVSDDEIESMEYIEIEAYLILEKIRYLLDERFFDQKKQLERNYEYKDIVVLLRTTKNWAGKITQILSAQGVPVYADVNNGYFEALEVAVFTDLLQIIDNKRQDMPLLAVLRSPICDFTLEELWQIRKEEAEVEFYHQAFIAYAQKKDLLAAKVRAFLAKIHEWREQERRLSMDEFIWFLLQDTGFYIYASAMPGGNQRQANLKLLYEKARKFQEASLRGLDSFLQYLELVKTSSGDFGPASVLGENDNVVRIMSIHKSKGLEFPAVILAGLGKKFNQSDVKDNILLHKELGLGFRYLNQENYTLHETIMRGAVKRKVKKESLSEEMRVLYVALTRARERLFLIGGVRNIDKKAEIWAQRRSTVALEQAESYLDWLGPFFLRHSQGKELRSCLLEEKWSLVEPKFNSLLHLRIRSKSDIAGLQETKQKKDFWDQWEKTLDSEQQEELKTFFSWEYDYPQAAQTPSKFSVTQLKSFYAGKNSYGTEIPDKLPLLSQKKEDPLNFGRLVHYILEYLNFKGENIIEEEIQKQLHKMVAEQKLTKCEQEQIPVSQIAHFFKTDLGQRILAAEFVFRELPFVFSQPVETILTEEESDDFIKNEFFLLQGVVDLCFLENEELVLVDYKTDRKIQPLYLKAYIKQLELYQNVLEKTWHKPVKASYLAFIRLGENILVEKKQNDRGGDMR